MRALSLLTIAAIVSGTVLADATFAIEAVRGKRYTLTDRHGPWTIMVASFRDVPKDRREEGLSAEEAALELIYELRVAGIPAYLYEQNAVLGRIETVDRLGREDDRIYAAQRDMISVIAGNYTAIDDKTAQKTLQWIKRYEPKFMKEEKSGAIVRQSPGRRGPLSGAFLTINPLLKPDDVARRKPDPEVARWNNSTPFPLLGCKAAYTVQVATFTGRQTTPISGSQYKGNEDQFDRDLKKDTSYGLNRAGEDAEHLVAELRSRGAEAYVHHDRYQSIVTVGGFASPSDQGIIAVQREYGPKYKPHPQSKQDVLQPETLIVNNPNSGGIPLVWVYDVTPQIIPVPRYK